VDVPLAGSGAHEVEAQRLAQGCQRRSGCRRGGCEAEHTAGVVTAGVVGLGDKPSGEGHRAPLGLGRGGRRRGHEQPRTERGHHGGSRRVAHNARECTRSRRESSAAVNAGETPRGGTLSHRPRCAPRYTLPLVLLLYATTAAAQESPVATALALEAVADDGTIVRIGEVTGRITVRPAASAAQRFGRITVSDGITFVARARADSDIPVYATGNLGGVLRVDGARLARVDALWRNGRSVLGRIVLGDTALEQVPMARARVTVVGDAPLPGCFPWPRGDAAVREGGTHALRGPGGVTAYGFVLCGRCPSRRWGGHRGGRACGPRGRASPSTVGCLGRTVLQQPGGDISWIAGRSGALGDGCPYEGRPALVAAGTRVHLRPDGAAWARIPSNPDRVWVHDTAPGTPWVELTFARGVQRAFPRSTCSTGWVRRDAVTWEVLREGPSP
jgi:hypothetical protein